MSFPLVRVDVEVLIAPADEDRVAEAIRAAVLDVVPTPGSRCGEPSWGAATDGADLGRQWAVEHPDVPSGDRRVRRFTMDVDGGGVADLVDELGWAAIDAICPRAREEERLVAGGAVVPAAPAEFPWSSGTRVVAGPVGG